ncbi:hypothetical protein K2X33_10395 [bacterium]|nr:hypothetical protein [bacterium]
METLTPPEPTEAICILSFEVTRIRLGAGPSERRRFWHIYRQELALNLKTNYRNEHVRICGPMLRPALQLVGQPIFYRGGKLVRERALGTFEEVATP